MSLGKKIRLKRLIYHVTLFREKLTSPRDLIRLQWRIFRFKELKPANLRISLRIELRKPLDSPPVIFGECALSSLDTKEMKNSLYWCEKLDGHTTGPSSKMAKKFGRTKVVMVHQIEDKSFEKYLLNQTNFDSTLPDSYKLQAKLAVKDEYSFGFLGLSDTHSERELEVKLISNIRKFLNELGSGFAYLLFHRRLRSLVAIELKTTKFKWARTTS